MIASATTKVLFSLSTTAVQELKKTVPARKRSQLIETLLINYFTKKKQEQGWQAVAQLKQHYKKKNDPIKKSAVQWLHSDRRSH